MSKEFEEQLQEIFQELAESQVELGPEFRKVLYDNLWDMYATDEDNC